MKILHIITSTNPAGAEHMLLKLLQEFQKSFPTVQNVVVTLRPRGQVADHLNELGIEVIDLNMSNSLQGLASLFKLVKTVRKMKPDLIQGWMYHGNLVATFISAITVFRIPVMWNIRQSLDEFSTEKTLTKRVIQICGTFSKSPKQIIYNSGNSKIQHEAAGYSATSGLLIPNGFDFNLFHPSENLRVDTRKNLGLHQSQVAIGLVARYDRMKDHSNFISSASIVAKSYPQAVFVLAGRETKHPEILRQIQDLSIEDRFIILDHVDDVVSLLNALDISCSSSWSEGFPNSIGEAMSCALPCAVTDAGDSRLLVGHTGMIVPPRNSSALACAIIKLVEAGPSKRREMGIHARNRIRETFGIAYIAAQYHRLYEKHAKTPL